MAHQERSARFDCFWSSDVVMSLSSCYPCGSRLAGDEASKSCVALTAAIAGNRASTGRSYRFCADLKNDVV
ncbi:hypothetical protein UCMB321_0741 [Pseudomonas batumici]|uniref:Uncharacterized protein n=1 Tax=Pseudomonas batumici TaxID=226910 RepID=A0A0C2IKL5_9PSED|nr:hypothetical protein UCMB321_0741 [Pseudomonas batumici]